MFSIGIIVIAAAALLVNGCTTQRNQEHSAPLSARSTDRVAPFDYNGHIGWIHGRCLAVKRADIAPGMSVQVLSLGSPQETTNATIVGPAGPESGCLALLPERAKINQKKGRSFYTIDLGKPDNFAANFMAVGLLGYTGELVREVDAVHVDINNDGKQETARVCQTREGVKFSVVPSDPRNPTPVWQDYYYLGYDTQPTCKD